jgi:hypothetical protein
MSSEILLEGDVVMLCRHLFDEACHVARRGQTRLPFPDSYWSRRMSPPKRFEREDGTKGKYDFAVRCDICAMRRDFDYIEEIWSEGRLHVADIFRAANSSEVC